MLTNMKFIFDNYKDKCILGFNVFGYEDAVAVIRAAEETNSPVILMTNKVAITHMPIPVLAGILLPLARSSKTDVVVHLDHAKSWDTVVRAVDSGYSSVMFDGSLLPLEENIKCTQKIVEYARKRDVSVEAEIGAVGYSGNNEIQTFQRTKVDEAKTFYERTEVDALAVAVGNCHRMTTQSADIDFELLAEIHKNVDVPLVMHGASGVKDDDLIRLVGNGVRKINIGTSLRLAFGRSLRKTIETDTEIFDRIEMFQPAMEAVYKETKKKLELITQQAQ